MKHWFRDFFRLSKFFIESFSSTCLSVLFANQPIQINSYMNLLYLLLVFTVVGYIVQKDEF